MRPHRLLMKAFGPFAGETIVDFDAMGNSIYLISGDTGAGKTTIFDGIIYALYGTASGGARSSLGTEAFHSDYAKDGNCREEMRVELTFSNAGRTYTAARRMYWGKKGVSRTAVKESTLSENGNTIVFDKGREDRDDVTAKVTEILGLDANQFRRIIMLAQGEFQKFLSAKSDERGVILGKLYDNRRHQDFQLRLKAAAILLKEKENAAVEEAKARLNVFVFPDGTEKEDRDAAEVDHPGLLPAICRILEKIDADLSGKKEEVRQKEEELKKLLEQKTQGEERNSLIDNLDSKKAKLAELDRKKEEMETLRRLVELAEVAEKVLPFERAKQRAEGEWSQTLSRIKDLENERKRLEERAGALRELAETTERKNNPLIENLRKKLSSIQSVLHFYDDLSRSLKEQETREKDLKEAEKSADRAQVKAEQLKKRQERLDAELQRLDKAGEMAVENARRELVDLKKREAGLEDVRGSIQTVEKLIREEGSLKEAEKAAGDAVIATETEHLRLNRAFIEGQAGLLARDLREKLQSEEEVVCPVCGARHTAADLDGFAPWHDEIPTRETVEAAEEAWRDANRKWKEAQDRHTEKANELTRKRDALLSKSEELLAVPLWEDLKNGRALRDALAACEEQITGATAAFKQACEEKQAKEKAFAEKAKVDEELAAADQAQKEALQKKNEAAEAAAVAKNSTANWRLQLQGFPDSKEDARNAIDSMDRQAADLRRQIDQARENHAGCLRELAANQGALETAYSEKEARKAALDTAAETFAERLKTRSFADEDSFRAALSPCGKLLDQEELAAWIKAERARIRGFEQEHRDLDAAVRQLIESTKGMERADLAAIEAETKEVDAQLKNLRSSESDLSAMRQNDRSVYEKLCSIQDRRGSYRKASEKLTPLVSTADGKYPFSRYVLTGFFHRIVERANIHLETMTDGEYCLVPKETGDGRTSIGLDLKVLNTITGLERETASLSGGQLFEASLSLALGLSDIVQMESTGTIQIDSMFIDEGFGSLDGTRLEKSIQVLEHLAAGKRQIGIISHVARLDECLPRKIHVIPGEHGSTVKIETDA